MDDLIAGVEHVVSRVREDIVGFIYAALEIVLGDRGVRVNIDALRLPVVGSW